MFHGCLFDIFTFSTPTCGIYKETSKIRIHHMEISRSIIHGSELSFRKTSTMANLIGEELISSCVSYQLTNWEEQIWNTSTSRFIITFRLLRRFSMKILYNYCYRWNWSNYMQYILFHVCWNDTRRTRVSFQHTSLWVITTHRKWISECFANAGSQMWELNMKRNLFFCPFMAQLRQLYSCESLGLFCEDTQTTTLATSSGF